MLPIYGLMLVKNENPYTFSCFSVRASPLLPYRPSTAAVFKVCVQKTHRRHAGCRTQGHVILSGILFGMYFFFIVRWCKVIFFEWCLLLLLTQIRPSFTFLFTSQLRCQARENSSSKAMMLMWSGCKFGNRKFSTLSPWRCGSSRRNLSLSSREIPGIVYPVYPAYPLRLPHQGGGRLCRP